MMQDQCQRFGVYQTHLPHSSISATACQTQSFKMLSNPSIPESFAGFYSHCAIIFITPKWCIFKRPPSSNLFSLFSPLNCSTLLTHTYLACQMSSTLFSSGFQPINSVATYYPHFHPATVPRLNPPGRRHPSSVQGTCPPPP